jgi:poly-gamma-glutamate capsule biosynthesis protein CapA/YwtB (metallophosphatase superfamily)
MIRRLPIPCLAVLLLIGSASPSAGSARAVLVFGGDTSFGESYSKTSEQMTLPEDQRYLPSLSALIPLLRGSREALVNLETPLAGAGETAIEGKAYVHWADPEKTVETLKSSGITAVSLANNHTMDLGSDGLEETLAALDRGGLARMGAGRDLSEAERPLVWEIPLGKRKVPVAVFPGFEYRKNYDSKFHFYAAPGVPGVNVLDPERFKVEVRSLKSRIPGVFVIAFPHWGSNYAWRTPAQARLAHALVDAGADLVLGHGAHQIQEIEQYKGRWIVYGLGNFLFHSPGRYGSRNAPPYSFVARLEFEENGPAVGKRLRLYPLESDNRKTNYRSRLISGKDFPGLESLLLARIDPKTAARIRSGRDSLGFHFSVDLERESP